MSRRLTRTIAALAASSALVVAGLPVVAAAAPAATAITITTDRTEYTYNDEAVVTIHLSPTTTSKDVLLYSQLYGRTRKLVGGGPVGPAGNFFARLPMWTKTVLTAVYKGDADDLPATDSITAQVHAVLGLSQHGYYGRSSDGLYKLYHLFGPPSFTISLTPVRSGDCVRFERQKHTSTGWRALDMSRCFGFGAGTSFHNALLDTMRGVGTRIRVDFSGDAANLAGSSRWKYYKWWS